MDLSNDIKEWPTEIPGFPLLSVRFSASGDSDLYLTDDGWVTINDVSDGWKVITSRGVCKTEFVTATALTQRGTPVARVHLGLCAETEQPEYDHLVGMLRSVLPTAISALKAEVGRL
jgi:hypothetical protein